MCERFLADAPPSMHRMSLLEISLEILTYGQIIVIMIVFFFLACSIGVIHFEFSNQYFSVNI